MLLLIYLPRKDERLSWPSWLTCSRRFTHIVVTCRLQSEHRTGSVRRQRPAFCQLVKSYEKFIEKLTCTSAQSVLSSGFLLSCIVYSVFSLLNKDEYKINTLTYYVHQCSNIHMWVAIELHDCCSCCCYYYYLTHQDMEVSIFLEIIASLLLSVQWFQQLSPQLLWCAITATAYYANLI